MVVMTNSDNGAILAEALIRRAAALYGWPALGDAGRLRSAERRTSLWFPSQGSTTMGSCTRLPSTGPRRTSMPAWFRAGLFAALLRFRHHPFPRRPQDLSRRRFRRRRDHARGRPQGRGGDRRQADRQAEAGGRRAAQEPRPRRRRQHLCADRDDRARRCQGLAPAGRYLAARFPRPTKMTARRAIERARTAAYIAYQRSTTPEEESDLARHSRQCLRQARGMAADAECAEARARPSRNARAQDNLRGAAREIWLPRFEFQRRLRCGEPARLLPVHRDLAQAHRLFALRIGRRSRQAGAIGRRRSKSASRG